MRTVPATILTASVPPALVVADPLLAAQVQAIIANPVAAQRPDLVHFALTAASSGMTPPDGASGAGAPVGLPGTPVPAPAAAALAVLLAVAAIALRRRCGPRHAAVIAAALVAALAGAGLPAALGTDGVTPRALSTGVRTALASHVETVAPANPMTPGTLLSALRSRATSQAVGTASRTWTSLATIEAALNGQHDRLLTDEADIAGITRQLSEEGALTVPRQTRRPGYVGVLRAALRQTVDDHRALLAAYSDSLQREYTLYRAAAQSPDAAAELQSVALHTPLAVQNAVRTNLDTVHTQMQQEAQIAAAEAEAASAAAAQNAASSAPIDVPAELLGAAAPRFRAPVAGVVSQPFGPTQFSLEPPVTYNGVFFPHFHTGLDIAAPLDTPVAAAADGVVILATSSVDGQGHLTGYGNYVAIRHSDGFVTLYGHLNRLMVSAGQTVREGQEIGLLGSTGWSTGPHVHFEIRQDGVYVNPAPFLGAQLHG